VTGPQLADWAARTIGYSANGIAGELGVVPCEVVNAV
jgi:hypothetical protein